MYINYIKTCSNILYFDKKQINLVFTDINKITNDVFF